MQLRSSEPLQVVPGRGPAEAAVMRKRVRVQTGSPMGPSPYKQGV